MRYMGSKRRFVKEFLPIILDGMDFGDTFVDACCGGCNVISEVPQTYRRVANDINPYLIGMWRLVVSGAELPKDITAELYNDVRRSYYARDGRYSDGYIGWVGYMASFNGRFFEAGYAARTCGRDYIDEGIRNIMRQRAKMTGVEFTCQDLYVTPPILYRHTSSTRRIRGRKSMRETAGILTTSGSATIAGCSKRKGTGYS